MTPTAQPEDGGDIFALSLSGAWPPRPLAQTPDYDGGADFSRGGRWLLFASTDSGPSQVYVSPYPSMDRKWPVSTSGGYITVANFDVLPDGSFVMTEAEPGSPRLTVVLNWLDVMKRQLAGAAAR